MGRQNRLRGSVFDKMYEVLLSQGRPVPEIREGPDRVEVTIRRRVLRPEVIDFLAKADQSFELTQREKITLGLLVQKESLTAKELAETLELASSDLVPAWMGRLQKLNIVQQTGRTKGTRYFIDPALLRHMDFSLVTSLVRIEPHRLDALVLEDLLRYPRSSIGEIHNRIGMEIKRRQVKMALDRLVERNQIQFQGEKRGRKYWAIS
jgi:ATP-dependent DNA helicase RecG